MDNNGFLYQIDTSNRRIISLDYDGQQRWECPFPNGAEYYVWSHLICDNDGTVYAINSRSQPNVFAVSFDGYIKWTCSFPQGSIMTDSQPTIGADGRMYVTADYKMLIFSIQ